MLTNHKKQQPLQGWETPVGQGKVRSGYMATTLATQLSYSKHRKSNLGNFAS